MEERSDIIIRCSTLGVRCSTFIFQTNLRATLYLQSGGLLCIYHLKDFCDDSVSIIIFYLAGADLFVTAAAVFQDHGTDIHR